MKQKATTLLKEAFSYKETRGTIITDSKRALDSAKLTIRTNRKQLEKYIQQNPTFLHSLEPLYISRGPKVAKRMAEASKEAGVGPMAAVAGVLADLAVDAMIRSGAEVAVVEDGGEASAVSTVPIDVALSAGHSLLSKRIGFRLKSFPVGVATSSGKYSHALSFGDADAATIFAENAGLADAAATAVGNVVKGSDECEAIKQGICRAKSIRGVKGVFILYEGKVGKAGEVPEIIGIIGT
jgi:ApbE superfamily uncharacterized protein (UPF0280 family)